MGLATVRRPAFTANTDAAPPLRLIEAANLTTAHTGGHGVVIVLSKPSKRSMAVEWGKYFQDEIHIPLHGYMGLTPQQTIGVNISISYDTPTLL